MTRRKIPPESPKPATPGPKTPASVTKIPKIPKTPRRRRCTGKTKAGRRCQAPPLKGTKRCAAHPLPDTERTPKRRARKGDWRPRFLAALEEHVMVSEACRAAGVSRSNAYEERQRNEAFATAWDEVTERSTEAMEREAYRRAVDGWVERGIYDDDGQLIGEVRKFSDTLLIFMLKARRPDTYRDTSRLELSGVEGAPPIELRDVDAREASDAAHDFLARVARD